MIVYNTTFHIEKDILDESLVYLKKQYIPKAVERRVLQAEEGEDISLSVQFHVKNIDTLNFWLQNEGNNLHRALVARFGHKIAGFSTLLEEIDWEK